MGDIHLENYGTWRDADGRLVWGVNDFDEAAEMPYALDLVRLATSAILAGGSSAKADDIASAIIKGYSRGLDAPRPVVLDRDYEWLRELAVVPDKERKKFWKKMDALTREPALRPIWPPSRSACRSRSFPSRRHGEAPAWEAWDARAGSALQTGAAPPSCARPRLWSRRRGRANIGRGEQLAGRRNRQR